MHTDMEARACDLAEYLLANNTTVRAAAKQFGVSKSTVHKDLTERLEKINPALYQQVRQLLDRNKAERHIRGGMRRGENTKVHKPARGHPDGRPRRAYFPQKRKC